MLALAATVLAACGNDPYPGADADRKVVYLPFSEPPKTLDPQVAYSTTDHVVTGAVYDTLLEYHFLERPYRLIPGLADVRAGAGAVRADGHVRLSLPSCATTCASHDDPCFALGGAGPHRAPGASPPTSRSRSCASPIPPVNSPVASDLRARRRLPGRSRRSSRRGARTIRRSSSSASTSSTRRRAASRACARRGRRRSSSSSTSRIRRSSTGSRWSSRRRSRGRRSRTTTARRAATSSPSIPSGRGRSGSRVYDKRSRIVLERNPNWYGVRIPEAKAPAARLPGDGRAGRRRAGLLDPRYVGKPLPFVDRVELRLDKEDIPAFTKFLQGYYDASGIIEESFDRIVQGRDAVAPRWRRSTCGSRSPSSRPCLLPRLQHGRPRRRHAGRRARAGSSARR